MQMKKLALVLVLLALIPVSSVHGSMVKIDLDALWNESDVAVLGTVSSIEIALGNRIIYRIVTIQVEDYFIQPSNETIVKVRIEGGEIGGIGVWVEDQPEFYVGERVFVFLRNASDVESDYGYTVYADFQGKFTVSGSTATQAGGESFTIPNPEDTWLANIPVAEVKEEKGNLPNYVVTAGLLTGLILLSGASAIIWNMRNNKKSRPRIILVSF